MWVTYLEIPCDQGAMVSEPHPLMWQLSALHRFRTDVDVAVVVVVLELANLIAHFTTAWAGIAT
ncbi:hypothetical protein MBOT_33160 [Mycobacterium botniense]|uniref:Uncharacterized protein n=1 Tax=Mycobacterium botniense TaxID=84962 RepID=A0A7I9Y1J8_9MYCO|nr:hypothetical protein MBOT_33160 [Mycobacterium botniense]